MDTSSDYWLVWAIYLSAATVLCLVFWHITDFIKRRALAYSLRTFLLAVILTPWYANSQEALLAPAIIVALLDAITAGSGAAVRALVPLLLAIFSTQAALIIALFILNKNNNINELKKSL
jgi:hypothetical protein